MSKIKVSKSNRLIVHIVVAMFMVLTLSLGLAAECLSVDWQDQSVDFSVRALRSERQINTDVSYFDLQLSPGEEHVLEVDIFNTNNAPMIAAVGTHTAGTNSGGVIDYDNPNVTDDSLQAAFADIAFVEEPKISIPANGSARARIHLTMPAAPFDGIMLGGITVKQADMEDAGIELNGTGIQNEYCYVIGVRIRMNDSVVEPDFRLKYVKPVLSNYHSSIAVNLQNYRAALAKGLTIEANIYYNKEAKPLYSDSSNDFDVAPNSNFDYIIPCSGKLLPGDYRLQLTAAQGERSWEFTEAFTITESAADDINGQAVNIPGINYYQIATILLSIVLVIFIISVIVWIVITKRRSIDKRQ